MRIRNTDTSGYAMRKEPFMTHNGTLYGQWSDTNVYTVYSYTMSFPIYIWSCGQWYENRDYYSRTTSRHRSQARPTTNTVKKGTDWMAALASRGLVSLTADRLRGGEV